jgi:hypothetical protein
MNVNPRNKAPRFCNKLQQQLPAAVARLHDIDAEARARHSGFPARSPRKIPIPKFLKGLLALAPEKDLSWERAASVIGLSAAAGDRARTRALGCVAGAGGGCQPAPTSSQGFGPAPPPLAPGPRASVVDGLEPVRDQCARLPLATQSSDRRLPAARAHGNHFQNLEKPSGFASTQLSHPRLAPTLRVDQAVLLRPGLPGMRRAGAPLRRRRPCQSVAPWAHSWTVRLPVLRPGPRHFGFPVAAILFGSPCLLRPKKRSPKLLPIARGSRNLSLTHMGQAALSLCVERH